MNYKFNITQHHDPYMCCFVILSEPLVTATTSECFQCHALITDK